MLVESNQIYNQDCVEGLKIIPDNSIDLCITSPPYKEKDGYNPTQLFVLFGQLYRTLRENSLFFLNFGHLKEDKFRPFFACELAIAAGFKLNDTIIWIKNHYTPLGGSKNLNNLTEFIFVLYKGQMPDLDRLSIGIPYQDKSNIGRYSNKDLKCGGNVWYINIPTITKKSQRLHKDEFPIELPLRCIKLANLKSNSVVIDPFSGSGSTCLASKKLGYNYLGFELNQKYFEIANERLKNG